MAGWLRRYPEVRRVVVNLKSDRAFRGVLWRRRRDYLVLRDVEILKPGGGTVRMDGEVVVMAENVDFMQVVG